MHAGGANRAWNLEPVAYFKHGDYVIKSSPFHKPYACRRDINCSLCVLEGRWLVRTL